MKYRYLTDIERLPNLTEEERYELGEVCERFAFRTNEYYASLIDWNNPEDPLRRIVVPHADELQDWGRLNASHENKYTVMQGFQHKYSPTVVLLLTNQCGGFCRFCFRKRLFMNIEREIANDISGGLEYIRDHHEVTNVLVTGGDPLALPTRILENAIRQLSDIEHVRIIRIGSKMPAYNPFRIIEDPSLLDMIETYSAQKRFYIMTQFNHPNELTEQARIGINLLQKAGAETYNQTPVIRGVNDNPNTLSTLFRELSFIGVTPYYVFQCRPTLGNKPYAVPVEEAYMIFQRARRGCAGLAKSSRYVMSHVSGKIEVIGLTKDEIILRYHQPASADDHGHVKIFQRNPEAYWLDDYVDAEAHIPVQEDYDD